MSIPILLRDKETGKIFVNPAKRYIKPFWLQTDPVEVTVAANGTSDPIPLVVDATGHVELAYALYYSTGPFLITVYDNGRRYNWSNREIHIDTFAGKAQRPFIFPESYFLNVSKGSRDLSIKFSDLSGAENKIRFTFQGRRFLYQEAPLDVYKKMEEVYAGKERTNLYFLTTEQPITNLVAGATYKTQFRVPSDSYFEVIKLLGFGRLLGTPITDIPFEAELQEYATGRMLQSISQSSAASAVRGDLMFGTAEYPSIPFESYMLERDYRLNISVKNIHATDTASFYFTLAGRRIRYPEEIRRM